MTSLFASIRNDPQISLDTWASYFGFNGITYPMQGGQSIQNQREEIEPSWQGMVRQAYKNNGIIFSLMMCRQLVFSEARFAYRRRRNGRPGDLYGSSALAVLENPWPNGTTGDLLSRAIQDVDLAGNFYCTRQGNTLRRMRPDWVTIIVGSQSEGDVNAIDAELIGYIYHPGGRGSGAKPTTLLPEQVAHFAPIPDPDFHYRGMSWLTPITREIMADQLTSQHKMTYFEQGATPNLMVTMDPSISREDFQTWVEMFRQGHEGAANAYKTLFLGGGADAKVIGANLQQMDFQNTTAAGETRMSAAAGVPPIIAGFSEGLSRATYSNFGQARRRFADGTMKPLWRNMAASMSTLVSVPSDSELYYDVTDIAFLAEDEQIAAEVEGTKANSISLLVAQGYDPDSVVDAITSGDMKRLTHTGLVSVQLLPPGTPTPDAKTVGEQPVPSDKPTKKTDGEQPIKKPATPNGAEPVKQP